MFSEFFIRRPIFASVISIVTIVVGLVALLALPIARYPEIAPPTITISASFFKAAPDVELNSESSHELEVVPRSGHMCTEGVSVE